MSGAITEFKITSDLSSLRQQVIEANFEEVRGWLEENLAPYRDMAVSADDLSTAKTYRANIRKVKDRIDQSRKEAKAAALEAYSAFESKCKELTGLCDDAANAIDAQVKAIEQMERDAKIAEIRSAYDELAVGELADYYPWDRFYNQKWENKGVTAEAAAQEISRGLADTVNDLNTIRQMGGDDTAYLLDAYKQTHDLSAVVRKASEIKTLRDAEERKRKEEAEIAAREAERFAQTVKAAQTPVIEADEPKKDEQLVTIDFRVTCTKSQLTALGKYMKQNGITYGRCVS